MNWKNIMWKYITAIVVVLIIFNPEMLQLALFIDAVGLEMFLMLLEIQIITLLGIFINTRIKPVYAYLKNLSSRYFFVFSWENIKETAENSIMNLVSAASLMHIVVISAAMGIMLNAY